MRNACVTQKIHRLPVEMRVPSQVAQSVFPFGLEREGHIPPCGWPWSKKPGASAPKTDAPQCGEPHSVAKQPRPSPQCGETKLMRMQRGENGLRALERAWRQRAVAPPSSEYARQLDDAKKLACELRRQIQAQSDLLGVSLSSG